MSLRITRHRVVRSVLLVSAIHSRGMVKGRKELFWDVLCRVSFTDGGDTNMRSPSPPPTHPPFNFFFSGHLSLEFARYLIIFLKQ